MTCMDIYNSIKNPIFDDALFTAMLNLYTYDPSSSNMRYYSNLVKFNSKDSEGEYTDHTEHNPEERDKFYVSLFNIYKNSQLTYFYNGYKDRLMEIHASGDADKKQEIETYLRYFEELEKSPEFKNDEEIQSYFQERDCKRILDIFYHVQSNTFSHFHCNSPGDPANPDEIRHKFYLNVSRENIHKLARIYAEKCDEKGLSFYFKIDNNGGRDESIVIYSTTENLIDNYNVLREIGQEMPELTKRTTPPVLTAGVLDGWIGYGAEFKPIDHQQSKTSYNRARANLLQEAYTNYIMHHLNDCVISPDKTIKEYIIEEATSLKCQLLQDFGDISPDKKEKIKNGYEKLFQAYLKDGKNAKSIVISFTKSHMSLKTEDLYYIMCEMVPYYFSCNDKIKQGIISEIKALSPKYNISPENFCFTLDTKRQFEEYDKNSPAIKSAYQKLETLAQKYNIKAPRKILLTETLSNYMDYLNGYYDEKLSTLTEKDKSASASEKTGTISPANNNFAADNNDSGYHFAKDKIVQDNLGHSQSNKSTNTKAEDIPYIFGKDASEYFLLKDEIIQDDLSYSSDNKSVNTKAEGTSYIFGKDTPEYHLLKKQIIQDDLSYSPNSKAANNTKAEDTPYIFGKDASEYFLLKDEIIQDDLSYSSDNKSANTKAEGTSYIFGKDTPDYHLLKKQIIQDDLSHSPNSKAANNTKAEDTPYEFGKDASDYRLLKDEIIQDDIGTPKESVGKKR